MFNGKRLKELRLEKKITQKGLGSIFNITHATINRYENEVHEPDTDLINKLSEFFNVSTDYLLDRTDIRNNTILEDAYNPDKVVKLPILGVIRAGEPLYAVQNIIGYSSIDANLVPSGECFYLKVKGDSMNLSHIVEGQLIMIRCQQEVENGEIALVLVNGEEATIKKFYKNENLISLIPNSSNIHHQPRVIDAKETSVTIIGKVVGSLISFMGF